jgi:hypothetical protein
MPSASNLVRLASFGLGHAKPVNHPACFITIQRILKMMITFLNVRRE